MVTRRACGSSDGWFGDFGGGSTQDGDIRVSSFLTPAAASSCCAPEGCADSGGAFNRGDYLWGFSQLDAGRLEKVGGVLLGEPLGFLHPRNFFAKSEWDCGQRIA